MDDFKELCIKQGYVPSECKLDGRLIWGLINDGRNPCVGCNAICVHKQVEEQYNKWCEENKKKCEKT